MEMGLAMSFASKTSALGDDSNLRGQHHTRYHQQ